MFVSSSPIWVNSYFFIYIFVTYFTKTNRLDIPGTNQQTQSIFRIKRWLCFSEQQLLRKKSDDCDSSTNQDVSGFEDETIHEEDILSIGMSWSGFQHWRDKKLPFPLMLKAAYHTHISSRNRLDRDDIQLVLTAVF